MNMLEKIQAQLEHLSKSERKVSDVILANPDRAIHSSIAALALEAAVSEPTVNRFCRSMATRGFPDFKLHLAQSLANGTPYGLTAAIFTNDITAALRAARRIESGVTHINGSRMHFVGAPFGGIKNSGIGGEECLDELLSYTEVRSLHISL